MRGRHETRPNSGVIGLGLPLGGLGSSAYTTPPTTDNPNPS